MAMVSVAPAARRIVLLDPLGGPLESSGRCRTSSTRSSPPGSPCRSVSSARVTEFSKRGRNSHSAPIDGPVVVVAHVLAQDLAPVALGGDVLGVGDRQRRDVLEREPPPVGLGGVGLVELLGADLRRRRLVHPDLGVEAAGDLRRPLDHQVAADQAVVVASPSGNRGVAESSSRRGVSIE